MERWSGVSSGVCLRVVPQVCNYQTMRRHKVLSPQASTHRFFSAGDEDAVVATDPIFG